MKNQTSFKPGVVTNPNGRPKREWTWSGLIEDSMEEQDETGVPYKKIVVKKLRSMGIKGDLGAIKEVLNRMDGMPQQNLDLTTKGKPLIVIDDKP